MEVFTVQLDPLPPTPFDSDPFGESPAAPQERTNQPSPPPMIEIPLPSGDVQ